MSVQDNIAGPQPIEDSAVAFVSVQRMAVDDWLFAGGGKLAAVWFDRLIIPEGCTPDGLAVIADRNNWSSTTFDEALRLFVPFDDVKGAFKENRNAFDNEDELLVSESLKVVFEDTRELFPNANEAEFLHEVSWASAGTIEALNRWRELHKAKHVSLVPTYREHLILQRLACYGYEKRPFEVFSEIVEQRLPNVAELTWDEAIDLRFHPFFKQFRNKIRGIQKMIAAGDDRSAKDIIDEVRRKDLIEMARYFRPHRLLTLVKGIASNLPMPWPNLLSAASSTHDAVRDNKAVNTFGWMYFLMDLEDSYKA